MSAQSLRRRLRSAGGTLLRRAGMLPGGMPDGLGEDDRLDGAAFRGDVVVHFPDTPESLYQLRSWYGPLRELHRAQGVSVVCMDSRVARTVRAEIGADIDVVTIARDATLDRMLTAGDTKLVLYVNYNPLNMAALRTRSAIHVSLLHGDSDKSVSVSNQIKAYDYSFVAGQAAVDRLMRYTALFDARSRCIPVGRPALDTDAPGLRERTPGDPPVVLYAPTWEGGQASVAYSSLLTHAEPLVRSVVAAGARLLYRPHPLTGVRVPEYAEADHALRALVRAMGQQVSEGGDLWHDVSRADLLVSDVSAVANDWLATGRPLMITRTDHPGAHAACTELLRRVPRIGVEDLEGIGERILAEITEDPHRRDREALARYYLGDTAPGASLERFLRACRELSAQRDEMWARIRALEDEELREHR